MVTFESTPVGRVGLEKFLSEIQVPASIHAPSFQDLFLCPLCLFEFGSVPWTPTNTSFSFYFAVSLIFIFSMFP